MLNDIDRIYVKFMEVNPSLRERIGHWSSH